MPTAHLQELTHVRWLAQHLARGQHSANAGSWSHYCDHYEELSACISQLHPDISETIAPGNLTKSQRQLDGQLGWSWLPLQRAIICPHRPPTQLLGHRLLPHGHSGDNRVVKARLRLVPGDA